MSPSPIPTYSPADGNLYAWILRTSQTLREKTPDRIAESVARIQARHQVTTPSPERHGHPSR